MKTVIFLGCSARKLDRPASARDFYQGQLFRKSLALVEQLEPQQSRITPVFVLSAKHFVLTLDTLVAPYGTSLNDVTDYRRQLWAMACLDVLRGNGIDPSKHRAVFYTGRRYWQCLAPAFKRFVLPLAGFGYVTALSYLMHHGLQSWTPVRYDLVTDSYASADGRRARVPASLWYRPAEARLPDQELTGPEAFMVPAHYNPKLDRYVTADGLTFLVHADDEERPPLRMFAVAR